MMEEDEASFPLAGAAAGDGWEAVPPPHAAECGRGWEMVASGASGYDDDDLSVFPPSQHEGLHLQTQPDQAPPPPRHQESITVPAEQRLHQQALDEEQELPLWRRRRQRQLLDSSKCLIGLGMEFIYSKIQSCRGGGVGWGGYRGGGAVWSFSALAGFLGALLYLRRRRRHRRERALLLLIIQEKDQKRSQLLHQIAQMNEVIAARHRVPVLRRI